MTIIIMKHNLRLGGGGGGGVRYPQLLHFLFHRLSVKVLFLELCKL